MCSNMRSQRGQLQPAVLLQHQTVEEHDRRGNICANNHCCGYRDIRPASALHFLMRECHQLRSCPTTSQDAELWECMLRASSAVEVGSEMKLQKLESGIHQRKLLSGKKYKKCLIVSLLWVSAEALLLLSSHRRYF